MTENLSPEMQNAAAPAEAKAATTAHSDTKRLRASGIAELICRLAFALLLVPLMINPVVNTIDLINYGDIYYYAFTREPFWVAFTVIARIAVYLIALFCAVVCVITIVKLIRARYFTDPLSLDDDALVKQLSASRFSAVAAICCFSVLHIINLIDTRLMMYGLSSIVYFIAPAVLLTVAWLRLPRRPDALGDTASPTSDSRRKRRYDLTAKIAIFCTIPYLLVTAFVLRNYMLVGIPFGQIKGLGWDRFMRLPTLLMFVTLFVSCLRAGAILKARGRD